MIILYMVCEDISVVHDANVEEEVEFPTPTDTTKRGIRGCGKFQGTLCLGGG